MNVITTPKLMPTVAPPITRSCWLVNRRYDLTFLIGNAAIVPLAVLAIRAGLLGDFLDAAVTALVGGPHLFATFSTAAANRTFRARHPFAVPSAALIPLAVVWMSLQHYQLLVSMFLGVASIHVLHQCAHLSDLYRAKANRPETRVARIIDYGVIFASMYPIALRRMVHGDLWMGGVPVMLPSFVNMSVVYAEWVLFASFLLAWTVKSAREMVRGALHGPKTLLIGVTVVLSLVIAGATDRDHLGLAFQAMNAWHSMQYLGLTWLLRTTRTDAELGPISRRLAGLRGPGWFYLGNVAITIALFAATKTFAHWNPLGVSDGQNYYMFILSPLLVHYYLDAFGFVESRRAAEALSAPAPVRARAA